ncbi:conserved hypothetical protein [Histoplasma mississippiense (nom. inval.)]|uniref:conserved hypothetical protein n=1 Tax=Ajellomyces capsulatus (strain NAm1 / WU24) TaxID=2059318 RepID=UPI000157C4D7|nr:conserved hypothetical protein [Histoplasma mississippiense (nom. inval.)]EDN08947.1 conserved hypothetical protein [Histoplasma mississippiense (nom. inval.)]
MAFEALLETIKPPAHPFLNYNYPSLSIHSETTRPTSNPSIKVKDNLLQPLLHCLDTSSLPSYFWRSLASSLSTRVQEIINRGGVSARTLRSNRERLREQLRECVLRGSHLPNNSVTRLGGSTGPIVVGNWEREAAVMNPTLEKANKDIFTMIGECGLAHN